jgi:iron(III) transport system ATP-binding protein
VSAVEIRGLAKTYPGRPPVRALRGVDLDIPAESLVAVLGPSGCGKTTMLRLVAGFDRPDRGTITIGGSTVAGPGSWVQPERRHVGIVPQEGALFPHLDVAGNIAFGLNGTSRRARSARVGELLALVGLAGYGRRRPHELSGGQQQRVALARALAPHPAVVLLDEPFAALDTGLRSTLRDDVAAVLASSGTTSVLVTHDQTEALTIADTVAVMRDGAIVQVAPPDELYRRPVDMVTARFIGDAVVLPGERDPSGTVTCILGRLPVVGETGSGGSVDLLLRPEQVVVDASGPASGTVRTIRFEGHDALVHLTVGEQAVLARWSAIDLPPVGAIVPLGVKGPAVVFAEDQPSGNPSTPSGKRHNVPRRDSVT